MGGALNNRAEIIPIEPDSGNAGVGNKDHTMRIKNVDLFSLIK